MSAVPDQAGMQEELARAAAEQNGNGSAPTANAAPSGPPVSLRNSTEQRALSQAAALYDETIALIDERTLEILERRRKTATIRRRGWLIRRMLLLADVVGLMLAFSVAELLFGLDHGQHGVGLGIESAAFLATLPAWILIARLYGLYSRDEERTDHSTVDEFVAVFHLATVVCWLFFVLAWVTDLVDPSISKLLAFWVGCIFFVSMGRAAARWLSRKRITYLQNAVIVGAGEVGQLVAHKLLQHPEYGINLVGFVDSEPKERRDDLAHLTLLGPQERLPAIVRMFDVERVIVAFSKESYDVTLDLIRSMKDLDVQVDIVPRLFDIVGPSVSIHTVEGVPLLGLPPAHLLRTSRLIKRTTDLVLAIVSLALLAPAFAVIAILIKIGSPGPVFFRQVRRGTNEATFEIYKFRTMFADADARKAEYTHLNKHATNGGDPRMFKIRDDPRTTRIGRFLRTHSFDELPQLINVVKGEMSLVGPRPLILEEDQHIHEWARRRLNLKPGITGPWQVLGRSEIPFEEMVKLDYLYVTSWSVFNDFKLILQTLPALARSRGAY
ncbi:MAG: sugar transferase [Actinobacteria bacterium]|nr:MAG: sugar transferase [Actinomycetota bacterium]